MANARKAVSADVPALLAMSAAMHAESPRFRYLPYSEEKMFNLITRLLEQSALGGVLVAEVDGEVVGMFGFIVTEYFFNDEKCAMDLGIYVKPEHRGTSAFPRMLRLFEQVTDDLGVADKQISAVTGVNTEKVAQGFEKLGYIRNGITLYKKR